MRGVAPVGKGRPECSLLCKTNPISLFSGLKTTIELGNEAKRSQFRRAWDALDRRFRVWDCGFVRQVNPRSTICNPKSLVWGFGLTGIRAEGIGRATQIRLWRC